MSRASATQAHKGAEFALLKRQNLASCVNGPISLCIFHAKLFISFTGKPEIKGDISISVVLSPNQLCSYITFVTAEESCPDSMHAIRGLELERFSWAHLEFPHDHIMPGLTFLPGHGLLLFSVSPCSILLQSQDPAFCCQMRSKCHGLKVPS